MCGCVGHSKAITCLEITRVGESGPFVIVTASEDKLIKLWNPSTATVQQVVHTMSACLSLQYKECINDDVQTLRGHKGTVTGIAIVIPGMIIASSSTDCTCKVRVPDICADIHADLLT